MAVTVELPADVERRLRQQSPDLDSLAKEAMLVELYRQDKLSRYELSQALGLSRFETDGLLKEHKVTDDLLSLEELEDDLRVARSRSLMGR
jgi:predicted HTH domain antitoxin